MSWKSRSRVSSRSWIVVAKITLYRGYSGYKPIFYQFENQIISEYDWTSLEYRDIFSRLACTCLIGVRSRIRSVANLAVERLALVRASVLLVLTLFSLPYVVFEPAKAQSPGSTFSFGSSGDFGSLTSGTGVTNLQLLKSINPDFFLGLGSLSYTNATTGDVWCSQFKTSYNNVEIIPGDHDTGGHNKASFGETHSYERYVANCPLTFGLPGVQINCGPVGCYGKEYYFDYPLINPIARFILIAPKIYNITGVCTTSPNCSSQTGQPCNDQYGCWQYDANDIHYNWTGKAIDDAHGKGIPWVIVATHKLCMSAADATCSMGIDLFNMLVRKKVDLIIQAHDDAYERSKQVSFNNYTCPNMNTDGNGFLLYNSGCIVDQGLGNYTKGAGSLIVVQGAWISDLYGVNGSATHPANTLEAPYFTKLMGKNTPGAGLGFVQYTVSASEIDVKTAFTQTVAGPKFSDSFSISTGQNPVPVISWSPLSPAVGQAVTFTASATGGVGPYSFTWDFGDGDKAVGTTVGHVYVSEQAFNVTVSVLDSANRQGSSRSIIGVGSWNPSVACSPVQTTIENMLGTVSIPRSPGNASTTGADYSGGAFKLAGGASYGTNPDVWPFSKRSLHPPCLVNGAPTFVELHNVTLYFAPFVATYDCRTSFDPMNGGAPYPNGKNCDYILGVANASYASPFVCPSTQCYMHRIYMEVDAEWNASGVAPSIPPMGKMIDVQGFVFWDHDSVNGTAHNWSGWELHPFTAWRYPIKSLSVTLSANPSSTNSGQRVSYTATVSGGSGSYNYLWDFGDGVLMTSSTPVASHTYTANRDVIAHLTVTDSSGGSTGVASTTILMNSLLSLVVGSDGFLYSSTFISSWTSWTQLGVIGPSPPGLCSLTGGRADLVVRGSDDRVYHRSYVNGVWSSNWDSPGGHTIDSPGCAILGNSLYIVVRGTNNVTYFDSMNLGSNSWSGWQSLLGWTAAAPVLVSTPSANRLDLILRGTNNGIYHMSFPGGVPTMAWDSPGGSTPVAPVSVSDSSGFHLVVVGQDHGLWYNYLNFTTGSWSGWTSIPGTSPSTPSLALDSSGTLHLVVRGSDNGIYHNSRSARGGWSSTWDTPGGSTPNAPATRSMTGTVSLLVTGADGGIYSDLLNGANWSGWVRLVGTSNSTPVMVTVQ